MLAEDVSLAGGAEMIAERLHEAIKAPYAIGVGDQGGLTLTASLGIATGERASADELLRDADIAMHRARWRGATAS